MLEIHISSYGLSMYNCFFLEKLNICYRIARAQFSSVSLKIYKRFTGSPTYSMFFLFFFDKSTYSMVLSHELSAELIRWNISFLVFI